MIKILKEKIRDKKLLDFIKLGLKAGIIFANTTEASKIGTIQGSVLSPLLFNIYMHAFDQFVVNEIILKEAYQNVSEGRLEAALNKKYNQV